MREALRVSLWCLFAALAMNTTFNIAQTVVPQLGLAQPKTPQFPDISPEPTPWLRIICFNPDNKAWLKPEWTKIITSAKPTVMQIGRSNRWEISFNP